MTEKKCPSLETIRKIDAEIPTPFHLYSESGLRERARTLNRVFSWNPGYKEYFAVKATPNPVILNILRQEGCGADCSSLTELMLAEKVGFSGDEIMFSSNETPAEEFEYARRLGAVINLDDITHIDFLEAHGGLPEAVCCRYNPGGDFFVGNAVMGRPADAKYGFTRDQLTEGIRRLMQKGVKKFGLHSFLASNMNDNEYYPMMARLLFQTAVELHEELGAEFFMINLSGGIGIPYHPEETPVDIGLVGERVREAFEKIVLPAKIGEDVRLVTELGRYVTGPCGWLVTRAVHEKNIYKHYIGVDACAANLMRPAMYGAYHHITVLGREDAPCDHMYDVVGSLCENNDKFAIDRALPEIRIGDYLVIHDTGAHGFSMGYNYNGRLRSAEVLLREDGSFRQIRRAETPADYFATLDFDHIDP